MAENHLKTIAKTDEELRVGNYAVLFGGRDLTGEYFTKSTDFESAYTQTGRLYMDWEHGLDDDPESPSSDDVLGFVDWKSASMDERGLWVERVLNRRNKYMQYIEQLLEAGLLGNSTEAVPTGVEKTADGEIVRWPLKRDTLTVNPAEPRMMTQNVITALKSLAAAYPHLRALIPQETGEVSEHAEAQSEPAQVKTTNIMEGNKMSEEIKLTPEEQALIEAKRAEAQRDPAIVKMEAEQKALSDKMDEMLSMIAASTKAKDAGYIAPDSEDDHAGTKSLADFLTAVRNKNDRRLKSVYKTALAEGAGTTGGYLVPDQYESLIMAQANELSVLRRAGARVLTMTGRTLKFPVIDVETAPSAGNTAYAGGAIAYWEDEAAAITESEPKFREIELVANKLAAYSLASNEVQEDAFAQVDNLLAEVHGSAIASKENYAFFRGDGVGKPYGILTSGALISASRSAASTIALADIAQMMSDFLPSSWGRGAWFISPDAVDQLMQMVNNPLSLIPDIATGQVPVRIFNMPVYVTGALPGLNTAGDILLVDPSYYLIGDRTGMSVAYSEHYRFQYDQGAWRTTKRVDGQPMLTTYITLENASTTVSPFVALAAG